MRKPENSYTRGISPKNRRTSFHTAFSPRKAETLCTLFDMPSMSSMTVTSDSVACVKNVQLFLEDILLTSTATGNSVKLMEEEVPDSSQGKKKQNRTKSVLTNSVFGSSLGEEYLKSEIEKNKSTIELNKSMIELNKSTIELKKSIIELNKLQMEVLRKALLRERSGI